MNLDNMPELRLRYAYFVLLGVMGVVATALVVLMRRKGWLGRD